MEKKNLNQIFMIDNLFPLSKKEMRLEDLNPKFIHPQPSQHVINQII